MSASVKLLLASHVTSRGRAQAVPSIGNWRTNADLIADVASLGYIKGDVVDVTYGLGNFWTKWRPAKLTACDIDPTKSPMGLAVDFTHLPWPDKTFDTVVFDPPYRLNGSPDRSSDVSYGVEKYTRWQDRMQLVIDGAKDCARITKKGGHLLVKCQDQVVSGQRRFMTDEITNVVVPLGFRKKDRFDMVTKGRSQPPGRSQKHSHQNASTLLVFVRES